MLQLQVVRRLFIFVLALSLAGMGSVPLSACAIVSSKMAECATPQTQSQCDQMGMDDGAATFAAPPSSSCCFLSAAPLPATLQKVSDLSVARAPIVVLGTAWKPQETQEQRPAQIEQALSPPSLQSVLCTFLI